MPEEMAGLIAHFKLIGRQFADVMRIAVRALLEED